ncbi:tetratricopeptide repeat protein [Streptomyces sp. NPDC056632]|uniref:tetratricopeptide repeat protein n=1 Tax=Streptomyces sp. NPDC056632 TaxID=3345884 RepID=UPI0036A4318D
MDAALIEVLDGQGWQIPVSLSDLLTRPPQRYGLFIGTRPRPVTATGFPRLQKDTGSGRRFDEQLTGRITPGTGALAGRYEVTSTTPTPGSAPPAASRWSGISGAAVLTDDGYSGDLLCGVVSRDRQADSGTRLITTTAKNLLADAGFRNIIHEQTGWEPVLEPVEPAPLLSSATVNRTFRSPAALLRAETAAVTFHGRDSELTDLRAWCEEGTNTLAIRVMTGPGGQGKTRLARHLTETLGREGWVTGHLRSDLTDAPPIDGRPPDFTTLNTAFPLLLVVDYAETRPRLLRRLITHLHDSRSRVRLLLLARSDGEWRTGSFQALPDVRDLLEEAPVHPLGPLIPADDPNQDRHTAFRQALVNLALLMPRLPTFSTHDWHSTTSTLHPPADLNAQGYDNILTLHMAALIALLQHGPQPTDTVPGTPPERTLLKHEERFWQDSAQAPPYELELNTRILRAAVATAALCGAGTKEEALRVIAVLPRLPAHQQESTAAWLASLYPPEDNRNQDRYWGSLQPDRIAEYHAAQTLKDHGITLPALLTAGTPGQQTQTITVLARAATAHYNANRTNDCEHVLSTLDAALDTTPLSYETLHASSAALPYPSRVITPLALRLNDTLTQANRHLAQGLPDTYAPVLASSLSYLTLHLSEAGRREEALAAAQEVVELYRRLAVSDPAAYEADLANSLSNVGSQLSEAGRLEEALTAAEEAVEVYRRLAACNSDAYEPNLARSLTNLGLHLSRAGRRDDALTATEEAAEAYRRLAAGDSAAYEPDLARSLTNLGLQRQAAGRSEEALTAAEEAVEIRRRLAAGNPAAYEANLALSLSNLGLHLSNAGRRGEAITAAEEAVEVYRRLAARNPAAHEQELARSLSNLGLNLTEAGRRRAALTATEEAVEVYRRLAASDPAAHEPGLASSLSNLGAHLSKVGLHEKALAAELGAVEIRRRLAARTLAAYEPDLARSLSNLGLHLSEVGRREEALAATEEAVAIYRRLAAVNPAPHEPDLALTLFRLGVYLSEAGQRGEALTASEEAVAVYHRLAVSNPTAYEPGLSSSLSHLGAHLWEAGRQEEAFAVERKAVEIQRRLAAGNPAAYEPELARSLTVWAMFLAMGGDSLGALRVTGTAVHLYGSHIGTIPSLIGPLSAVLNLQADLLEALGHAVEAGQVRRWLEESPLRPYEHD